MRQDQAVRLFIALMVSGLAMSSAMADSGAGPDEIIGRWRNPKGSVQIDIRACGQGLRCGYVVWASEKAINDARRGGTEHLVGLELFRGLTRNDEGLWRGSVFVPDLNSRFSGTARRLGSDRFLATGCLLRGILCKSQIWTLVDQEALSAAR